MPDQAHQRRVRAEQFLRTLSREERILVVLKAELYDGAWDEMVADLQARLEGKPYIVKLATRIEDDLKRIETLRAYEQREHVNLSDYIKLEP
jgi:hypothetical protein